MPLPSHIRHAWRSQRVPLALALVLVLLLILSPEEKTIGWIIKLVYVHVALIWVGTTGYALLFIVTVLSLFSSRRDCTYDLRIIHGLTFGIYAMGVLLSMAAATAAWGSVSWTEPLMQISLTTLALSLTSCFLQWGLNHRFTFLVNVFPGLYLFWATAANRYVLHPNHPITEGTPLTMKLTFYCSAIIFLVSAIWIWHRFRPESDPPGQNRRNRNPE
ncbi:MAG: hypothetical protein ACE5D8_00820 [Fidelibacterota bacterium]